MQSHFESDDADYSPSLSMELILAGQVFNVAAIGGDQIRLRDERSAPAGNGVVRMVVNGNPTEFGVYLPDGVCPTRAAQPCRVAGAVESATA